MAKQNKQSLDSSLSSPSVKSVAADTRAAFSSLLEQRAAFFSQKIADKETAETPANPNRKLTRAQKTRMICDAACVGDIETAKAAIEMGASPNAIGARDRTAVDRAFISGHDAMLAFLLDSGGRPTESTWDAARWAGKPDDSAAPYRCVKLLCDRGHKAPKALIDTMSEFHHNHGSAALLALAESGQAALTGEQGVALAYHILKDRLDPSLAEKSRRFISPGPWQQRLSFSDTYLGKSDTLLADALRSDRVDLFLFLLDTGYLEGVAKAQWKCDLTGTPLSLVSHAIRNGSGRIAQTLARVPAFSSQFKNISQAEADHMLFANLPAHHRGKPSHEAWRGFWEGGGDPYVKTSHGDTLLHVLAGIPGGGSLSLAQDLLRRAPGIEDVRNDLGKTVWDIAGEQMAQPHYRSSAFKSFIEKLRVSLDEIRIRKEIGPGAKKHKASSRRRL